MARDLQSGRGHQAAGSASARGRGVAAAQGQPGNALAALKAAGPPARPAQLAVKVIRGEDQKTSAARKSRLTFMLASCSSPVALSLVPTFPAPHISSEREAGGREKS